MDQTGVESDAWTRACDELAWLMRSKGVIFGAYSASAQTLDLPVSQEMHSVLQSYHETGWLQRDPRARAFPMLMGGAAVTDFDLFDLREIERNEFYAEFLRSHDLKWFASAGYAVDDTFWAVSVHRAPNGPPFSADEVAMLRDVMEPFQLATRRTKALGQVRTDSIDGFLTSARRAVAILGWSGQIIRMSDEAETLLRRHQLIRQGRLHARDEATQRHIDLLVARGLAHGHDSSKPLPPPLVVRDADGGLVLDLVPTPRDFASLLSGAAALFTVHEVSPPEVKREQDFQALYGLTPREVQLCKRLVSGEPLARIADEMGITVETARQYLKSAFSKTGTSRQTELVLLLFSLRPGG